MNPKKGKKMPMGLKKMPGIIRTGKSKVPQRNSKGTPVPQSAKPTRGARPVKAGPGIFRILGGSGRAV